MSAIKARALICAALAVAAFFTFIAMSETRQQRGPVAWCDLRTMNCYDQLGRAR